MALFYQHYQTTRRKKTILTLQVLHFVNFFTGVGPWQVDEIVAMELLCLLFDSVVV